MSKKYVLIKSFSILILLMLLSICVSSIEEKVFSMNLIIYKNNTVFLTNFSIVYGIVSHFPTTFTDYLVRIVSIDNNILFEENLSVSFILLIDPPIEGIKKLHLEYIPLNLNLPFFPTSKTIQILYKESVIFEYEICKLNEVCEYIKGENYLNCPKDCPSGSLDFICDKIRDGICDPDCEKNVDPDCIIQKEPKKLCLNIKDGICEEDCPHDPDCRIETKSLPFWILIIIIFVIIVIIFIYYYRKTKFIRRI